MKKYLALLLALTLVFTLAACGDTTNPPVGDGGDSTPPAVRQNLVGGESGQGAGETGGEEDSSAIIDIDATIYCDKKSHKGIIIGKQGAMLKKIGQYAREDIERFMGAKVFLQTWVKVKENWRDSAAMIRNFGYER